MSDGRLAPAQLEEWLRKCLAELPPLRPEQRRALSALITEPTDLFAVRGGIAVELSDSAGEPSRFGACDCDGSTPKESVKES